MQQQAKTWRHARKDTPPEWRTVTRATREPSHGAVVRAMRLVCRRTADDVAQRAGVPLSEWLDMESGDANFVNRDALRLWEAWLWFQRRCSEDGCQEDVRSDDLCRKHFDRARKESA